MNSTVYMYITMLHITIIKTYESNIMTNDIVYSISIASMWFKAKYHYVIVRTHLACSKCFNARVTRMALKVTSCTSRRRVHYETASAIRVHHCIKTRSQLSVS